MAVQATFDGFRALGRGSLRKGCKALLAITGCTHFGSSYQEGLKFRPHLGNRRLSELAHPVVVKISTSGLQYTHKTSTSETSPSITFVPFNQKNLPLLPPNYDL